jgi:hypothetical protein
MYPCCLVVSPSANKRAALICEAALFFVVLLAIVPALIED